MAVQKSGVLSLDEKTRRVIEEKFVYKRQLAKAKENQLFGIFDLALTADEELALKFLYACMPLNDLADYDGSLFLSHVRQTLRIRDVVTWGHTVPDSVFFHFVLPYRVNNENIEDVRGVLFEELYPRVKGMSMTEAVLETNHWCHEKANYIGNDIRTVSPLTLMRTALGRCGEQSTLAVAALRSIGIPARQVYTPRWAHCDSNHAWVEAWTDGGWHFLGACEPEPRLDQGWFRKPARRAMLVHTRVPANYPGPEEVTFERPWYSELNLSSNYAAVRTVKVNVAGSDGKPAQAKVDFQLYNFAEFSTVVPMVTDESGEVSVTLGLGDVLIYAYGDDGWGFAKCDVRQTDQVTITLSKTALTDHTMELDMVPPPELPDMEGESITEEERRSNDERVKRGAQIRADYEATFLNEKDAESLAASCSLPPDRVWSVLKKARGNSKEIAAFLREQSPVYGEWCLRLLESLNDKDFTDTFRPALKDHLVQSMPLKDEYDEETFCKYILRPRVDFEMITPYRVYFRVRFPGPGGMDAFRNNPLKLVERIRNEIEVIEDLTHYKGSATPVGTFNLKKGDRLSRDILFVAVARTAGIPARLDPVDKTPQYLSGGTWVNVSFGDTEGTRGADASDNGSGGSTGYLHWVKDESSGEQAKYFHNFTLARFENGAYKTLYYEFGKTDVFDEPFEVAAGHYRLTTGTRLADGTALVRFHFFEMTAGNHSYIPLVFRQPNLHIPVIGSAELNFVLELAGGQKRAVSDLKSNNGIVLAWFEPDREPSKHFIREMRELKGDWDALGIPIVCIVAENKMNASFSPESYTDLPELARFGQEAAAPAGLRSIQAAAGSEGGADFPVICAIDGEDRIRYYSAGYKLGICNEVVKIFKALDR
ncbi:transglutaminase domain-containing protein [Paenibacillus alkalitolerans]|uniref:transglutaminase domain-containing protein n=1 Tax=Paenibacillus alkalitolerans TaxID=2799335 RepID=UPI0018F5A57A|nr:transglutaminase domain-containing protein [Paenibacillus alkalitolerans]